MLVGIEATGSMHWFLRLLEELEIEFRVGHPAKIRAAEPRKQKNDHRDARLLLTLLAENRFAAIWMPSREQHDLQVLLRHRDLAGIAMLLILSTFMMTGYVATYLVYALAGILFLTSSVLAFKRRTPPTD